ncbi:MAG: 3-keto-5-aminohexanoate cleavage protein [Eubacterium ramulus]
MAKKKTIITAAVTGAWPKKKHPNVPMTPAEIADDVYACWQAGAAVAHLHMRDDEGNGTMDHNKFRETVELLHSKYPDCDIILTYNIRRYPRDDESGTRKRIETRDGFF